LRYRRGELGELINAGGFDLVDAVGATGADNPARVADAMIVRNRP
jgi:hypothetical protein